jgi:hypothetical protein
MMETSFPPMLKFSSSIPKETTFTGDKVVRFQLLGSNNSVSINWGDGITETYAGSAANTIITHTYAAAGLYLVSITGAFENIKLAGFTGSQASDLASVLRNSPDWSPTNLTDLYNGCSLIKNDSLDDFPDTSLITLFVRAFTELHRPHQFPVDRYRLLVLTSVVRLAKLQRPYQFSVDRYVCWN